MKTHARRILAAIALATSTLTAGTPVAVTTYHNDNQRTGWNSNETILTPASVASGNFARLFSHNLDGQAYAQPLYVPNVTVNGAVHNVVFVATENDSVYAFDADSNAGANAAPLWQAKFADPVHAITPVPQADTGTNNITPRIGITSTPVIDLGSQTIYVVAKTKETVGRTIEYVQRLHALDITTGAERPGSPVVIVATYPGTCGLSDGHNVTFNALLGNQRSALLLNDGMVYIAWASHGDGGPYSGWVMAYDAATLQQMAVLDTVPDATGFCAGGIWNSGSGPAADAAGNVFFTTANGLFNANNGGRNYGNSIVKTTASLIPADFFTPFDQYFLNAFDIDLGSGGVLLLPTQAGPYPDLLVQAGKEGTLYVVNRDSMGGYNLFDNSQIVQSINGALGSVFSAPVYANGAVYFSGSQDNIKRFPVTNGELSTTPATTAQVFAHPGPGMSVSSAPDGSNAILWALDAQGWTTGAASVLYALDAGTLAVLYSSHRKSRDAAGPSIRFNIPTVANGKVYVGTANSLVVYGALH